MINVCSNVSEEGCDKAFDRLDNFNKNVHKRLFWPTRSRPQCYTKRGCLND